MALGAQAILDTEREEEFDEIVKLASEACGMPMSVMSLVDADRQWFKAAVGIEGESTHRDLAFCAHAILQDRGLFVVEDATKDDRFATHPAVLPDNGIRFYAGAILKSDDGFNLGTLCVVDNQPRQLTSLQERALITLGHQVEAHLRLRALTREMQKKHEQLERLSRQKDELVALMVHDLKSPLAAILPNASYLAASPSLNSDEQAAAHDIEASALSMQAMVLDMLDVDQAENGQLKARIKQTDLGVVLAGVEHMVRRRAATQDRALEVQLNLASPMVATDGELLRRVLENLVDNALKYSPIGSTITLSACEALPGEMDLKVCDQGTALDETQRARVFDKYVKLNDDAYRTSRGLGLTFCQLAVTALGGRIWVEPNATQGNSFCIRVPMVAPPNAVP